MGYNYKRKEEKAVKKEFMEPEVTVVRIDNDDVICTSSNLCGGGANETSVSWF